MKYIFLFVLLCANTLQAQEVWMIPNKGQWDERIVYNVELVNGNMIIEKDGFTFSLSDIRSKVGHKHEGEEDHQDDELIHAHVIKSKFLGSNWQGKAFVKDSSSHYSNYFLGNNQAKWKSKVYGYSHIAMQNLYPGIDLVLEGKDKQLKYSYLVAPGHSPSAIQIEFTGSDKIWIDNEGRLHINNRFGEIQESAPVAWTIKEGKKKAVMCHFSIQNNIVSFEFPNGFDETAELVIDPSLTFSSFTGSIVDNWGFTAAPDVDGNLFGGGIVFGTGYPLTSGAFDLSFNGGTGSFPIDIGITKFNANGTALIYSTYIGGNGNETPQSIISAPNGDLFIYGVTSSPNFPMAGTPYDPSFNGGPTADENSLNFVGSDIYVARLNATGTSLIASTYIGGSNIDGLNRDMLQYNYGDQFRGEIVVDAALNVYVASSTYSGNFPVVGGMQGGIAGTQDAVVFKMPGTLSSLTWSTFFGGTGNETGNALQLASNGNVYFTGGTTSNNLPITNGLDLSANGGLADGYVAQLNGTNGSFISGTYMGFNEYDQAYFVQLDIDDKVYVFGQTQTAWPITPGKYGTANSGQFIQKYNAGLTAIEWTTMIGSGSGNVEISPTAFLVSDCYDIYLSGWGGVLNANSTVSQAINSSTNGFEVTVDAFQPNTNGSNFYIAVLDQDASMLKYATYMGGVTSSSNHVDGGTSRFDKSGRIYHAVCGACGGNDFGFTSTPGVWSPNNPSPNCNLAAFKFELSTIDAIVAEPEPLICMPDPVVFANNSANGNTFFWNFGDNTTSTEVNPTHFYAGPGDYTVTLVVTDSNGCFSPDSVVFDLNIGDFQGGIVQPNGAICPGDAFQLEAFGGSVYSWTPVNLLDDPTSPTPTAVLDVTTTFTVIVSDSCGSDTLQVTVPVLPFNPVMANDTSICIGNSTPIWISDGATFAWTPSATLNNATVQSPIATPTVSTTYFVEATSVDGCTYFDSVRVDVYYDPPIPIIPDQIELCLGSAATITVSGAETYLWSPNMLINTVIGPTVVVSPTANMTYYCDFTNACGTLRDSVLINIVQANIQAGNDTIICPGEIANLWASGGITYTWYPQLTILNSPFSANINVRPLVNTQYGVIGVDQFGCIDTAYVQVDLFPQPFIQTSPDVQAMYGDLVQLSATSTTSGSYVWSPVEFLSCVTCQSPTTSPNQNMIFTVTYTDANGCSASDDVLVSYDPFVYIPNTFTPGDGDEFNNGFSVIGGNLESFELTIYNRWGELLYTITSFDDYWDGTFKDVKCQDGTYVWKLRYYDYSFNEYVLTGHVNLLR
ncbi:MAG: gliding motility-associated C-terminal domain-containing protein [Crocinitomicaceae bacterium]|nr:gliding motility-associated C-terminal domain-containing protein [Crocinitomicaceae bacterium]